MSLLDVPGDSLLNNAVFPLLTCRPVSLESVRTPRVCVAARLGDCGWSVTTTPSHRNQGGSAGYSRPFIREILATTCARRSSFLFRSFFCPDIRAHGVPGARIFWRRHLQKALGVKKASADAPPFVRGRGMSSGAAVSAGVVIVSVLELRLG